MVSFYFDRFVYRCLKIGKVNLFSGKGKNKHESFLRLAYSAMFVKYLNQYKKLRTENIKISRNDEIRYIIYWKIPNHCFFINIFKN